MVSRANPRYDDKAMDAAGQILNIGSAVVDVAMLVAEVGREVPIASAVLQAFLVVHDKVEKVNANKDELEALRDRCRNLTAAVVETCGGRRASLNLKPLEDCLLNAAKVVEECGAQKGVIKYLRASKDKDEIDRINTRLDRLVNDTGLSGTMKILGLNLLINQQTLSAQPVKRYDEAEEVLRQSLEIKKVTLGEDDVSGREETKLGTADRRGDSTSARSPSRFGNTANLILYATRVTARAAQSSSIYLVLEVAVWVERLVGLVEDSRTNPDVFKKSNELCCRLKVVLENANRLPGLDTNPSGVSDLLQCVKDSVESLVGVMKAYQDRGKVSQMFTSSAYLERHGHAEEAVREMLQYFHFSLTVHVAQEQAQEQERWRKEMGSLKETLTELIGNIDLQSHVWRPKAESVDERRAKLLGNMEIAMKDIKISDNVLGEGVSGKVYFADYRGFNAAAKIMELKGDRNEKKQRNAFLNELQHMKRLASAHTVQVFGVVTSESGKLTLVMELMPGGDLFLYMRKKRQENQTIPEKVARRLIGDVAAGMDFLHSNNTWHGDLKSPNVLLDASDRAKISDFGTSYWTEQTKSKSVQSNYRNSGTAWFDTLTFRWAAPEVLSASEEQQLTRRQARTTPVAASPRPTTRLSFKSDVYSFAIIAWEILSLEVPWDNHSSRDIYLFVCGKQDRPKIPEGAPPDLAELVRECWDASPERRPTSRQILDRLGRNRR